jgi:hypothetical protein
MIKWFKEVVDWVGFPGLKRLRGAGLKRWLIGLVFRD